MRRRNQRGTVLQAPLATDPGLRVGTCRWAVDNPPPVGAAPNLPPVAVADTASTAYGTPVSVAVLANDSDPDGDTLAVTSVTPPANGTATINAATTVAYAPTAGYSGPDSFGYTIADGRRDGLSDRFGHRRPGAADRPAHRRPRPFREQDLA